jgi:hypothetical protein
MAGRGSRPERIPFSLRGTAVFRNAMSEVSLSAARKASASRSSYRPAVEALEQRTMLNGDMMPPTPMPVNSNDTALVLQLTAVIQIFDQKLVKGLHGLNANTVAALGSRIKNFQLLGNVLRQGVQTLLAGHDPSDSTFTAAVARFEAAFEHFDTTRLIAMVLAHHF